MLSGTWRWAHLSSRAYGFPVSGRTSAISVPANFTASVLPGFRSRDRAKGYQKSGSRPVVRVVGTSPSGATSRYLRNGGFACWRVISLNVPVDTHPIRPVAQNLFKGAGGVEEVTPQGGGGGPIFS